MVYEKKGLNRENAILSVVFTYLDALLCVIAPMTP